MAVNIEDLAVRCDSFAAGESIPRQHAVEGDDRNPILEISGVPGGTVELAVVCHDPDAPMPRGFTHWLVYGLPPNTSTVGDADPGRTGPNSLGENAWTGPNPPPGTGPITTTSGCTRWTSPSRGRRHGRSSSTTTVTTFSSRTASWGRTRADRDGVERHP